MRKLLHLVFAIWKSDMPFDLQYYSWEPHRRFAHFAELAIYDLACHYAEGKRVLHIGAGVGYGDYYMAA